MEEIKAYYRREERYEGLQIVFWGEEDKKKIADAIEAAKQKRGVDPDIFENCYPDTPEKCAFYIEFPDDYDKEAGPFFEEVLCAIGVKQCS